MSVALEPKTAAIPTAEEWYENLGRVPMHRILFDPLPGTATEADVLRLDDHEDRLCELVDGTLVEKVMGFDESQIGIIVASKLLEFVRAKKLGTVTGSDGMMRILLRRIRIPDVAFISNETLAKRTPESRVPAIAPDIAVEVISDSNTKLEMSKKLDEYFAAGSKLVWYIDPEPRTINVYTSPGEFVTLTMSDTLTGGDVLPGFEVKVSELFDIR